MSYLFLIAIDRENDKKEIIREENFVEGDDFATVAQYAEEHCRLNDDEIVEVRRIVPICGRAIKAESA